MLFSTEAPEERYGKKFRVNPVLLALLFIVAPWRALAQTDISGNWDITFDTPQGSQTVNLTLMQDGNALKGELMSPFGTIPVTGTIVDDVVKLAASVDFQGQKFDITSGAKIEEGRLIGSVTFGDFGEFPFTGKRAAARPAAPAPPDASTLPVSPGDISGKWNFVLTFLGYQFPITAALTQDGEKISGTLTSAAGEIPVTGTMIDRTLKLDFTAKLPVGEFPVTITGDLGADGFVGKATVAGIATDWTGKKVN